MNRVRACKDALARLAEDDVIARASAAVVDLDTAARFREEVSLGALATAVERAEGERASRGREALRAFERYRTAAGGDHFQAGHDSHLGPDAKARNDDAGDPYR